MNKKLFQKIFMLAAFASILLLSACKVNMITEINKDGSGMYIQELGFQGDEASMSGYSEGDETFCEVQNEDMPPNTTTRQETRNEDELWCVYETPFESLEDLRTIYSDTDTSINTLELESGTLTYDISLDLSGDSSAPMGADVVWMVTMPGKIISHNADTVDGNTLTWQMRGGEINKIQATSEVGGLNFGGNSPILYILGGGAALVFCCIVPLVIGGVVFFLMKKKKSQE